MRKNITANLLDRAKSRTKPYFIRSANLRGFGVKITPAGSIRFIAEVKVRGVNHRKTLGSYPLLSISEAEQEAVAFIRMIQSGHTKPKESSLRCLLDRYVSSAKLKPSTTKNYKEVILFYLHDWLDRPVKEIARHMIEERFVEIRDRGILGGQPTYSQATKTMRILSALMNYAIADGLIDSCCLPTHSLQHDSGRLPQIILTCSGGITD